MSFNAYIHPPLFSAESTLSDPAMLPNHLANRVNFIRKPESDRLVDLQDLRPIERLLWRQRPLYTLLLSKQVVEFRFDFEIDGRHVSCSLRTILAIHADAIAKYIQTFHKGKTGTTEATYVTVANIREKLQSHFEPVVRENLTWSQELVGKGEVRSIHRHHLLEAIALKEAGMKLFVDELRASFR